MLTTDALSWALKQYSDLPARAGAQPTTGALYLTRMIGISRNAVRHWGDVVPLTSALLIHIRSGYQIPFRARDYPALWEVMTAPYGTDAAERGALELFIDTLITDEEMADGRNNERAGAETQRVLADPDCTGGEIPTVPAGVATPPR